MTALVTGILLIPLRGLSWTVLFSNPVLLAKLLLLLGLMALLSTVHLRIQPAIENLLGQVTEDNIPKEIAERLAAFCLFLVITTVMLGMQLYLPFSLPLTAVLMALTALFSWRVYHNSLRFGWL